ncbi:uncharacterized protein LOC120807008 [Xiphias gladius]|uniref:uncharacterized protein LOC120807008 n=1 Tax=Xiphias gladius TaxID=8245 RepID=UPI001A99880D|nr:uncharacterized protein LOC120807008 [Xiphias gladius]
MRLYGNPRLLAWLTALSVSIIPLILWLGEPTDTPTHRTRSVQQLDSCLHTYGGIELNYTEGSPTAFLFDLCQVIKCGRHPRSWRGYDAYLCGVPVVNADCAAGHRPCRPMGCMSWCSDWSQAVGYTGQWSPYYTYGDRKKADKISLAREQWSSSGEGSNPMALSIERLTGGFFPEYPKVAYFVLGVEISGRDPQALIKVNFLPAATPTQTPLISPATAAPGKRGASDNSVSSRIETIDYSQLKPLEVIRMATGYSDDNLWLKWVTQTAKEQGMGNCVACASGRPQLVTVPAPLFPSDSWGYNCMTGLTKNRDENCFTLASLFPPISNDTAVGPFTPNKGNGSYVCFNFTTPRCNVTHNRMPRNFLLGQVDASWCGHIRSGEEIGVWARGGLYYYCGRDLHVRIRAHGYGLCAMVRLRTPLILVGDKIVPSRADPHTANTCSPTLARRRRRHVIAKRGTGVFDLSVGSPTYMDAIGVPRGVPDQYKLVDQVAAGFENMLIIAALFPVTPNKNVDRINYVHYNVLCLANLTRDAVAGLAEQTGPTSLMAVQNRMALDMLLAEKGGVCAMFGDACCTYIPNNTAPDGSVNKALEGLRTLSDTMHEQSGLDNPLDEWMTSVFGRWKGIITSLLLSIATFIAILTTCGCCCIPCIRALSVRLIDTAIQGRTQAMMPLLLPVEEHIEVTDDKVRLRVMGDF